MNVGVLVLAAGRSTRYGSDKRIATLASGVRVLDAMLGQVILSGLPAHVALHPGDDALAARLSQQGISSQCYDRACEGMGATLAQAIVQIDAWDGALIALADMPWIQAETFRRIANQLAVSRICVPTYGGVRGHPVGFDRCYFKDLSQVSGQMGARSVLQKNIREVYELAVEDRAIHWDIDVPDDINRERTSGFGSGDQHEKPE